MEWERLKLVMNGKTFEGGSTLTGFGPSFGLQLGYMF
jgi:hypothetical protein